MLLLISGNVEFETAFFAKLLLVANLPQGSSINDVTAKAEREKTEVSF